MTTEAFITFGTSANLLANPIRPEWILEGQPVARTVLLTSSEDGTASTYFWDCTAGRFNWFYGFDETFHILEGGVTLKGPDGNSRQVKAGDTVFFPAGSNAEWTVDKYVRKLAFCRTPLPKPVILLRSVVRGLKSMLPGSAKDSGSGLL
jgi:uncharacterized protein